MKQAQLHWAQIHSAVQNEKSIQNERETASGIHNNGCNSKETAFQV